MDKLKAFIVGRIFRTLGYHVKHKGIDIVWLKSIIANLHLTAKKKQQKKGQKKGKKKRAKTPVSIWGFSEFSESHMGPIWGWGPYGAGAHMGLGPICSPSCSSYLQCPENGLGGVKTVTITMENSVLSEDANCCGVYSVCIHETTCKVCVSELCSFIL